MSVVAPPPDTSSEYKTWASSGAKPKDIPRDPVATYGRRGEWVSWDDFLGRKPTDARRRPRGETEGEIESGTMSESPRAATRVRFGSARVGRVRVRHVRARRRTRIS